jgi:hypothetical protein
MHLYVSSNTQRSSCTIIRPAPQPLVASRLGDRTKTPLTINQDYMLDSMYYDTNATGGWTSQELNFRFVNPPHNQSSDITSMGKWGYSMQEPEKERGPELLGI